MPRPTTKKDLIEAANNQFAKMQTLIANMSVEERQTPFEFGDDPKDKEAHWKRDKNLRDIFIHLYEWHQLLLNWVIENQKGNPRPFLLEPYNWRTYGEMNVEFWKKHQDTPYEQATDMLNKSHKDVLALIKGFSNEELFEKSYFPWSGNNSIGSYCVSATASHYDWAMKKIKRQIKKIRGGSK